MTDTPAPGSPVNVADLKTHTPVYVNELDDIRYMYKDSQGWYFLHATSERNRPIVTADGIVIGITWPKGD